MTDEGQFKIRLTDKVLVTRLIKAARRNARSINKEIIYRLRTTLEIEEGKEIKWDD